MVSATYFPPRFSDPGLLPGDRHGAFVAHAPYRPHGYADPVQGGSLSGETLGVKDLYDVAGLRTGAGSPAWLADAQPAEDSAPVVDALLAAGAQFVGKTLTDELAWSLNGENAHYGTPTNVAAPGRIPGGSSAGSAAAVAGLLCSIGLGSDTGGSVRLPASYCGLWGLRPTHGSIDLSGAVALAPSFDTAGWFTRDAKTFAAVGDVLLPPTPSDIQPTTLLIASDLFDRVDEAVRGDLLAKAELAAVRLGLLMRKITLADDVGPLGGLSAWREAFRIVQSAEAWAVHGDWVTREEPAFGPGIRERFAMARALGTDEVAQAKSNRTAIAEHVHGVLSGGALLIVPGAAGVAPPRGLAGPVLDDVRARALEILCTAGLAGVPQLALPALATPDGPVGLGLLAPSGADRLLLSLAETLEGL
ncbi:MAG: amidase [Devosiaceae bacterium]|nr:amidase [Devosiaceae bacterium MH13]